jgi:hypothetical protein
MRGRDVPTRTAVAVKQLRRYLGETAERGTHDWTHFLRQDHTISSWAPVQTRRAMRRTR